MTKYATIGLVLLMAVLPVRGSVLDDILALGAADGNTRLAPGRLLAFPLDNRYLVLAGDYHESINRKIHEMYGPRLALADRQLLAKRLPAWSHRFLFNFAAADVLSIFAPQIRDAFERASFFRITVNGEPAAVSANGYWINAVGSLRVPRPVAKLDQCVRVGDLVYFAYLELKQPLTDGARVRIVTDGGEQAAFTWSDRETVSRAIKVNQEGYVPDAGRKYAYLGMWLGSLGAMNVDRWIGKPFFVRSEADGKVLFQGKIALRAREQKIVRDKWPILLDGENVLEMDFSECRTPGRAYIQVPGVGRSFGFLIGDDALGRAFYVHMRGLFHQRSGIAKTERETQWTIGRDHPFSYEGGFPPNDRHYKGKGGCFFNAEGKQVSVNHFDVVKATATDRKLPEVYGGWWDAGDFDRRTYHFKIVDALLSSYLVFPDHFSDNQLDLPESGNGIPDIVDEAAWGVDVWRRAQNAAGGVGCWLEATSHPLNPDPAADTQRYYLALPTRESTIEYAAYAAKLARAYRKAGAEKQAALFLESARRAWTYAMNPANRVEKTFRHPKHGELTYREPAELPEVIVFKAALNLYMATGEEAYARHLEKPAFEKALQEGRNTLNVWLLSEFAEKEQPDGCFLYTRAYQDMVMREADKLLLSQEQLAYRNINWPMTSPYFTYLGWGQGLPLLRGAFFAVAARLSGEEKYRDAGLLLVDWMQGANPMGRSLTTGLGQVYPVRLLSLPNNIMNERFSDPIPGLTVYTFNGRSEHNASKMIYSLDYAPRRDHHFGGCKVSLLPHSLYGKQEVDNGEIKNILRLKIPLWRRFANLEGDAVAQNEFTVWETIAPAAATCGALMKPGWKPPREWKGRKPVKELTDLPGYIFLP